MLVCEQLIDVRSGTLANWQAIVIEGERIEAVMDESDLSRDLTVTTRLEGQTCMPGLMDMHVHIISESSPMASLSNSGGIPADYAYGSVKFAERTLMAGFTLVRDLGSSHNLAISLRDAINRGDIVGPRIAAAGKSIATTEGMLTRRMGVTTS